MVRWEFVEWTRCEGLAGALPTLTRLLRPKMKTISLQRI